jgi:hypothetical protein
VDFSDYLAKGNWEKHIPVTLTIRTPLNGCMTNPGDTLVSVTRNLFFTETALNIMPAGTNHVVYQGYFSHDPDKEVTLEYINKTNGDFRGFKSPNFLTVGLPVVDTFFSRNCMGVAGCSNYLHFIQTVSNPETCAPLGYVPLKIEWIMLNGINKLKAIYTLKSSKGINHFEFIGDKIK